MSTAARATHSLLLRHGTRRGFFSTRLRHGLSTDTPSSSSPTLLLARDESAGAVPHVRQGIMVRPWDGISSMTQALAIVRGIERKNGRVRAFSLSRDPGSPQIYTPYFWLSFRDPESYDRIPKNPPMLKIEVPVFDASQPGGVGLQDLDGLISSRYSAGVDGDETVVMPLLRESPPVEGTPAPTRVVEVRIEHSTKRHFIRSSVLVSGRSGKSGFRAGFYSWGGFAPVDPEQPAPWMKQSRAKWEGFIEFRRESLGGKSKQMPEEQEHEPERTEEISWDRDAFAQLASGAARISGEVDVQANALATPSVFAAEPSPSPSTPSAQLEPPVAEAARSSEPAAPRLSKRERILAQARENARTPLLKKATPEERAAQEEREKAEAERARLSMRDRLWKLMGGKWL